MQIVLPLHELARGDGERAAPLRLTKSPGLGEEPGHPARIGREDRRGRSSLMRDLAVGDARLAEDRLLDGGEFKGGPLRLGRPEGAGRDGGRRGGLLARGEVAPYLGRDAEDRYGGQGQEAEDDELQGFGQPTREAGLRRGNAVVQHGGTVPCREERAETNNRSTLIGNHLLAASIINCPYKPTGSL